MKENKRKTKIKKEKKDDKWPNRAYLFFTDELREQFFDLGEKGYRDESFWMFDPKKCPTEIKRRISLIQSLTPNNDVIYEPIAILYKLKVEESK